MNLKWIVTKTMCLAGVLAVGCQAMALDGAALERIARDIRLDSASCKQLAPPTTGGGLVPSYPLPVLVDGVHTYRILFYGLGPINPAADPKVSPPAVVGRFAASRFDPTASATCEPYVSRPESAATTSLGPRWASDVEQMDDFEFRSLKQGLYDALVKAASEYFSGSTSSAAKAAAQDFVDRFQRLSEPGLRPYYRDLSPDFWEWIRQRTGRTF